MGREQWDLVGNRVIYRKYFSHFRGIDNAQRIMKSHDIFMKIASISSTLSCHEIGAEQWELVGKCPKPKGIIITKPTIQLG